jgi:hypothetical protein
LQLSLTAESADENLHHFSACYAARGAEAPIV